MSIKPFFRQAYLALTMQQIPSPSTSAGGSKIRTRTCPPQRNPYDSTCRTSLAGHQAIIYAWPSLGGVIIHDHANAVDLEFLGLDPLDPPMRRLSDQADEDRFCQKLLLLGATWWKSEARFQFLRKADALDELAIQALEDESEPAPTMAERRFVSSGWPSTGGVWIAEFDTTLWGIEEEHNLVPDDIGRLYLARTMDERSIVLRNRFGAKFYSTVSEYQGHAFLNAWMEREALGIERVGK